MTDRLHFYAKEYPCVEMALRDMANGGHELVVMIDGRVFSMNEDVFERISQHGYQVSVCETIDIAGGSYIVDKMINSAGMKPVITDMSEKIFSLSRDRTYNTYTSQQFGLKPAFIWEERQLYCGGLALARLRLVPATDEKPPHYVVEEPVLRTALIECGLKRGLTEWRTAPLVLFDFEMSCKILKALYTAIFNDMAFTLQPNRNFIP